MAYPESMERKARILIVEDEPAIRQGLVDVLLYHGFDVAEAADGEHGLIEGLRGAYDLVLLDIMLPKRDGYSVCEALREKLPELAIIMLTARSGDDDIVQGLKLGADDYVAKPFSIEQLLLRIRAVLRRTLTQEPAAATIRLGNLIVDTANLTDSRGTAYTRREIDVLQYLHAHPERPVPREELLHRVWGYQPDAQIETRTVDIHIAKLRRKIEADSSAPAHIVTIRGAGYRLDGAD